MLKKIPEKKKPDKIVISTGLCKCKEMPAGKHGLEGFQLNGKYKYELVAFDGVKWVRVYPGTEETPDYFEQCSIRTFNLYFNILKGE
jgi:hypothetical protein